MAPVQSLLDEVLFQILHAPNNADKSQFCQNLPRPIIKRLEKMQASYNEFLRKFEVFLTPQTTFVHENGEIDVEATVAALRYVLPPQDFFTLAVRSGIRINRFELFEKLDDESRKKLTEERAHRNDWLLWAFMTIIKQGNIDWEQEMQMVLDQALEKDAVLTFKEILEASADLHGVTELELVELFIRPPETPSKRMQAMIDAFCGEFSFEHE